MNPFELPYLIYSREHNMWWKPGSNGYTLDIMEAGRYSQQEAEDIVKNANEHSHELDPQEFCIPDPYKAIKQRDDWKALVVDQCETEKECRKLLAAYDESDSYCVDNSVALIEKVLRHFRDVQDQLTDANNEANYYRDLHENVRNSSNSGMN